MDIGKIVVDGLRGTFGVRLDIVIVQPRTMMNEAERVSFFLISNARQTYFYLQLSNVVIPLMHHVGCELDDLFLLNDIC